MSAHRQAALTGPKPGIDWMMASRRESSASAAVAAGDVGLEGLEGGAGAARDFGTDLGAELAEGAELLDELAAEGEQVAELLEIARLGRGGLEIVEESEAGEHGRIDAVVFACLSTDMADIGESTVCAAFFRLFGYLRKNINTLRRSNSLSPSRA